MAGKWQTIVVSPHFDDGALSLGGFLAGLGEPAVMLTVFGGCPDPQRRVSGWDRRNGHAAAAEAWLERRDEDAAACAVLGMCQVTLSYPDSPYLDGDVPLTELTAFLTEHTGPTTRVLVPMGIGNRDHKRARDWALQELASIVTAGVYLYADLPYAANVPGWSFDVNLMFSPARLDKLLGRPLNDLVAMAPSIVKLGQDEWQMKRRAVLCYASQLVPLGGDHGLFLRFPGPLQQEVLVPVTSLVPGDRGAAQPAT